MALEKHKQVSVAEFFEKNRHLLGFNNPAKSLLTSVKEAVDNSLDACEVAGILPEIFVKIQEFGKDKYKLIVEDNGPGLNKKVLAKAFGSLLYGSKFRSTGGKQGRGQQGIGISAVILYGQLTTGKPAHIISRTKKDKKGARHYKLHIDVKTNEPDIIDSIEKEWKKDHGTRIEVIMEGKYMETKQSPIEFIKQTAVVNPHAQIEYVDPLGKKHKFPRVVDKLPKKAKELKPHPYGVEYGIFKRMARATSARSVKSFLTNDFDKVGSGTANRILEVAEVDGRTMPKLLDDEQLQSIHATIKETKIMNPSTDCLSPIGSDALAKSLESEYDLEFVKAVSRNPTVYRGFPFQVEVAIGYGGELDEEGRVNMNRFANKVPLLYEEGSCAITKAIKSVNWKTYGLHNSSGSMPTGPAIIVVHVASVWVPFTSESKAAVSNYPDISKELKLAIQDAARSLQVYVRRKVRAGAEEEKRKRFRSYSGEVAQAVAKLITVKSYSMTKGDLDNKSKKIQDNLLKIAKTMYSTGKDISKVEEESDDE
tara:strand:- start:2572 stop:4182 length:1611 start_codon:yes stop_codon:yes gene_type:complete